MKVTLGVQIVYKGDKQQSFLVTGQWSVLLSSWLRETNKMSEEHLLDNQAVSRYTPQMFSWFFTWRHWGSESCNDWKQLWGPEPTWSDGQSRLSPHHHLWNAFLFHLRAQDFGLWAHRDVLGPLALLLTPAAAFSDLNAQKLRQHKKKLKMNTWVVSHYDILQKKKQRPKNKYAWFFVFVLFLVAKALGKKHKTEVKLMNWNPGRRNGLAEYKWDGGGGREPAFWEDQDREEELCDLAGKGGNWILILAGQHAESRDKNIWMAPGCLRRGILLEAELQAEPRGCMTQRNWCSLTGAASHAAKASSVGWEIKAF